MIRLRTLGTLDLTQSDGLELRAVLSQPRRVALLAYLAVATPHAFHRRDHVVTLFWPEDDVERARASLNRAIYFLRRELGDGVIVSRGAEEIGLNSERFWCDAASFDAAVDRADLEEALELYRGDLLPGFFASRAEGFERWLENARARFRERAATAAWSAAAQSESRGELALAARFARRGVELAPFNEVDVRRFLTLLNRAGDRAGAARAYREFVERMANELELAPSPETRALMDDIRSREVANGMPYDAVVVTRAAPPVATDVDAAVATGASDAPMSHVRQARRRTWLAVGAVTVTVAVTLAFGLPAVTRARIDPRTVSVIPLANRTGDRTHDDLGRVAAARITESLTAAGLVDAVPPDARATTTRTNARATLPEDAVDLAAGSHAARIVSGEFHRANGRIVFQAWITDARRNRIVWAVGPISAPADSATRAIEEVSSRATGAIAALGSPSFASWFPIATSPPTFGAFQEFAEATNLQSRGFDALAIPHLKRAIALDTTFTWARMQLALAYLNLFEQPPADSIVSELNRNRDRLNPLQRHWLAWLLTFQTEDYFAGHRALRAAAELAPERFRYNLASLTMRLNRPREAIEVLRVLNPNSPHAGGPNAYWTLLTRCYHAVGDVERELRAAREARRSTVEPMNALSLEVKALAALGRIDAVEALLDTALALPKELGPTPLQLRVGIARISSPGQVMISAARELRAHGHEDAAQETLARALAWYRAQPAYSSKGEGPRFQIAHLLYLTRDWAGADTAFHALAAVDTTQYYIYLGWFGAIAARRNDVAAARRIIATFDSLRSSVPQPKAVAGYWQSKISSILGDERHALTMIAEVWPQGLHDAHSDFDYERMWKSPGFLALIRPKG